MKLAGRPTLDHRLARHVEAFPADGRPQGWEHASDISTDLWDATEILAGAWVIPDPDDGPIGADDNYDPENPNSGARAAAWRELPPWAADDVEASIFWTGVAPLEATPLLHVDPDHDGFGIGCWPGYDLYDEIEGPQSVFLLGVVGKNPDDFVVWESEVFTHPDGTGARLTIESSSGAITVRWGATTVFDAVAVPGEYQALLGSRLHGIALDNNQTDGNGGAGGSRPANLGAAAGPFVVRSTA